MLGVMCDVMNISFCYISPGDGISNEIQNSCSPPNLPMSSKDFTWFDFHWLDVHASRYFHGNPYKDYSKTKLPK